MLGICKLCLQKKELKQSHIIPQSYFRKLKKLDGQLIILKKGDKPKKGNIDPKEHLLCTDCEQFLSSEYEHYGIRLLRDGKKFRKNANHLVVNSFNYKKFYLYLLSILWRASIAQISHYDTVKGHANLDEAMRYCIFNKILRFNKLSHLRIDHFIRICVFRMVDSTNNISDELIRGVLSNFAFQRVEQVKGVAWYFLVEGFVIFYIFALGDDYHHMRRMRLLSQLKSGSHQKLMKIEISKDKLLTEIFNGMITLAQENDSFNSNVARKA